MTYVLKTRPKATPIREAFRSFTIFVKNELNADVRVRLMANRERSTDYSVVVGEFEVKAVSSEARTVIPAITGWLPYVYLEVEALGVPTSGRLSAWWIREREVEEYLIRGLELRDTATHNPLSDPNNIFIVEW